MKARTILGLIACTSVCATLSAFGNTNADWFSVTAANDTVTKTACNVTIGNADVTTATGNVIELDTDKDTPLIIKPLEAASTTESTKGDGVVKITGTAVLTPSAKEDFEETDGAKAGFAVGIDNDVTNFYGYANGTWTKLTGQAANYNWSGATTFMLLLDYRKPSVSFYVGETLLAAAADGTTTSFNLASDATSLTAIDAFGSGSITSISSQYEVAVAAVVGETTTRYGSIAEAIDAAGNDQSKIAVVDSNGSTGTANELAANGIPKWECVALGVAENASLALAPSDKAVSGKITLKLAEVNQPAPGVTATFGVNDGTSTTGSYPSDCIVIPTETGTYTIVPTVSATAN